MAASSSSSSGTSRNTGADVVLCAEHLGTYLLRNSRGFTAKVSLYGAQVISWKNDQGVEMLFLSSKAIFEEKELIRGGIPICFPGSFDRHEMVRDLRAFASKSMWRTDVIPFHTRANKDEAFIDLNLIVPSEPYPTFPHNFEMRLRVLLNPAGKLIMTTRIRNLNTNGKHFQFTFAYHNYLSVSDIREVRVEGLETLYYLDYLQNKEQCTEQADASTFESEVDRLYVDTNHRVTVMDHRHNKKLSIVIDSDDGLPDIVVWNPWDKKAKTITNFAKDEYNKMLCVGPACMEKPIVLKPDQEWTGRQELMAETINHD